MAGTRGTGERADDDPRDTRTLILQTAEALFLRHGYAAVSMSALVEEVSRVRKLSKPAIYYHFADKETLFVAVVRALCERTGRELDAVAATDNPIARIQAVVATICHSPIKDFPRILSDADEHLREAFREQFGAILHQHVIAPLERCFASLARDGVLRPGIPPPIAATTLIGLVAGFSAARQEFVPLGAAPDPVMPVNLITDLLLHGVGT